MNATCDWCGKEFEATPDSFLEGEIDVMEESDESWKGEFIPLDGIDLEELNPEEVSEIQQDLNISREQVGELFKNGKVEHFACVCGDCIENGTTEEDFIEL